MTVTADITSAEVAGHFTSQADCTAFQASIAKYHLLDPMKETSKGNVLVRTFSETMCVPDPTINLKKKD